MTRVVKPATRWANAEWEDYYEEVEIIGKSIEGYALVQMKDGTVRRKFLAGLFFTDDKDMLKVAPPKKDTTTSTHKHQWKSVSSPGGFLDRLECCCGEFGPYRS